MCYNGYGDNMSQVDEIVKNLSDNEFLSDDIKQNFLEVIIIFNRQFGDIDLSLLNNRIKTLKVRPISEFLCSDVFKYDVTENVLFFNETKLAEVTDGKNIMMKALLAVISNRIEEKNNILFAFNKGMDEMIANSLVGNRC